MKLHAKKKEGNDKNPATLGKREENYDSSTSYLFTASITRYLRGINAQKSVGCGDKIKNA